MLVGGVFINKGGFQFGLQVGVARKGIAGFGLAPGIKGNELAGNVFDLFLGLFFHFGPGGVSQFVYLGWLALRTLVFADAVQRMDVDQQYIVVSVNELNGFLTDPVLLHGYESPKASDA